MKAWKGALVLIIAASVMAIAIQQTPSILLGQHYFVNLNSNQNDINCTSCHPQIADELAKSQIHSNFACEECHRIKQTAEGKTITYAEQKAGPRTIGEEAHAAYVPRCLDCHGGNGQYIDYLGQTRTAPVARAFNTTPIPDYVAHKNFVEWANQSGIAIGENEACLACHTNFSVQITYRYFYDISYRLSNWNLQSFSVNGTREYTIDFNKSGDQGKHEWKAVSLTSQDSWNQSFCIKCHKNIYDALVNGTPNPYDTNEPYITHAPAIIDTEEWNPFYHTLSNDKNIRSLWVNTTYCIQCHNDYKYSLVSQNANPRSQNSANVHAAEAIVCFDCHTGHRTLVDSITNWGLKRVFVGDLCMGCHEAAVHPSSGQCGSCHSKGSRSVYIESEPSGYCINSKW
ncbi:cytochrome c3 family protein [Geoglobus ahangari]